MLMIARAFVGVSRKAWGVMCSLNLLDQAAERVIYTRYEIKRVKCYYFFGIRGEKTRAFCTRHTLAILG